MDGITALTPEWRAWIVENLARQCSHPSMVEAMVRSGFEADAAQAAVAALAAQAAPAPAREPTAPVSARPAAYVYETPRLPAGNRLHAGDREVQVLLRVNQPVIAVLGNVLSASECDELIERSRDKLERSTTVDPASGGFKVIAERSSEGTFFALNADPLIARLDRRLATLMGGPVENGEGLQILHYRSGGEYRPHFDYFPPDEAGSAVQMAVGGQRVATLVMYLNDVPRGGGTVFPRLELEVCPAKGSAVYFEYTNSRGQVDPLTLHGGAPVLEGEKWIMTKWMRQRRRDGAAPAPA